MGMWVIITNYCRKTSHESACDQQNQFVFSLALKIMLPLKRERDENEPNL